MVLVKTPLAFFLWSFFLESLGRLRGVLAVCCLLIVLKLRLCLLRFCLLDLCGISSFDIILLLLACSFGLAVLTESPASLAKNYPQNYQKRRGKDLKAPTSYTYLNTKRPIDIERPLKD